MLKKILSFVFLLVFGFVGNHVLGSPQVEIPATDKVGSFKSPNNDYSIKIEISGMGGYRRLLVSQNGKNILSADDITKIVWIDKEKLVYSVSPMYSETPGIFLFDGSTGKAKLLLGPKHFDKGYQGFTDYFELKSYSIQDGGTLFYYYTADVDATDFTDFRTKKYLYKWTLSGGKPERVE